ncbi:gluconate 2-dehydrogenase subunit 3 family protein [Pararhizobium mangrovi]|nr:gluconate 2-dehydrogenase subunit 3 family protein [Pararhizobium mangrovi]
MSREHLKRFRTPYPDYNVLAKWDTPSFDDVTRRVIAHRLEHVPKRRFLDEAQYALLRAVMDTVLPQPERSEADRIPLEALLDEKLAMNLTDGTRHKDVLTQREAWPRGLAAIDAEAHAMHGRGFLSLSADERHSVLEAIDTGRVDGEHWKGLVPKSFFRHVLLKQAVKIYYSHPAAWNEIGFGGPAAPRGYLRLGPDMRDPWEAEEKRRPQEAEDLSEDET